jgi:TonB family protein
MMNEHHNKKRFLNLPKYIGGSEAFKEFITKNLIYPSAAVEARIEGKVVVEYDISDEGTVLNPHVLKGLGHGCDEEALRLVGLLRFEKVRNRGVRVKVTTKTTINFQLPGFTINYSVSNKEETEKQKAESLEKTVATYNYTIQL